MRRSAASAELTRQVEKSTPAAYERVISFVMDQGVVDFVIIVVAGARRTPGRLKTGGVPPKPPATIFLSLSPSVFWDFGSLHQKPRVGGQFFVNFVMGLMVGDRRFPGATILGARFSTSSANHPVSVPPTGPEHSDASWCGQCTSWQFPYFLLDLSSCAS